jgi:hypothetical protein
MIPVKVFSNEKLTGIASGINQQTGFILCRGRREKNKDLSASVLGGPKTLQ